MSAISQDKIDYIKAALLQCLSSEGQKQGEKLITDARDADVDAFLQTVMKIFNEPPIPGAGKEAQNQAQVRNLAAILFKSTLHQGVLQHGRQTGNFQNSAWFSVDATTRGLIRESLLNLVQTNLADTNLMRDACTCISAIACVEVPHPDNLWGDFVSSMSAGAKQNQNLAIKQAAMITLGLFMEDVPTQIISNDDIHATWDSLLTNTKNSEQAVLKIVPTTMLRLAETSKAYFDLDRSDMRDSIMQGIFDLLLVNDEDVQKTTLQALIEICRFNYPHMKHYLEGLQEMTKSFMDQARVNNEPLSDTALLAIEVWNFLAEEERDCIGRAKAINQSYNGIIMQYNWMQLVQMFLEGIDQSGYEIEDDRFGDDIDNSVSIRCAIALSNLSQLINTDEILKAVLDHATMQLKAPKETWLKQYIAIRTVNCTIEGPPEASACEAYSDVVPWLLHNCAHESTRVRAAASSVIADLALYCSRIFISEEQKLQEFFDWFGTSSKDHASILVTCLRGVANLFNATNQAGKNGLLCNYFQPTIQVALDRLAQEDVAKERQAGSVIEQINEIVQYCDYMHLRETLLALADNLLDRSREQAEYLAQNPNENSEFLVNQYGGMLQVIFVRLEKHVIQIKDKIMVLVTQICSLPSCRTGACLVLNGLLHSMSADDIGANAIVEVIIMTINDTQFNMQAKRLAVGLVQDLVGNMQEEFNKHLEQIVPQLLNVLRDSFLSPDVKTTAIMALGDICLMSEKEFHPYIKETMDLLIQAGSMTLDEDAIAQMDPLALGEMRHALIDSFVSITNGLKCENVTSLNSQSHGVSELEIYKQITNIFFYMESLLRQADIQKDNVELAHQIIDLYSDIISMFFVSNGHDLSRDTQNQIVNARESICKSDSHMLIQHNFGQLIGFINAMDDGETISNFERLVRENVLNTVESQQSQYQQPQVLHQQQPIY